MIVPITPEHLQPQVLATHVLSDMSRSHYWTDVWDPSFYVALAREGFISIAHEHADFGPVLLPELQCSYAVLDWANLHQSRNVRRLRHSGRMEADAIEFRVERDPEAVMRALTRHHGKECWLIESYRRLMAGLAAEGGPDDVGFSLCATELWSLRTGELVAGELGYSIGCIYTSLSGFCMPGDGAWRDFGTLQLVLLAEVLRDSGYAFWNLGHPHMEYKQALGARVVGRSDFLFRWHEWRDQAPARSLVGTKMRVRDETVAMARGKRDE